MRNLRNVCLVVILLGLACVSYAGQKIVIRYDQDDAMQVFGVGDLKKARKAGKEARKRFPGNRAIEQFLSRLEEQAR